MPSFQIKMRTKVRKSVLLHHLTAQTNQEIAQDNNFQGFEHQLVFFLSSFSSEVYEFHYMRKEFELSKLSQSVTL